MITKLKSFLIAWYCIVRCVLYPGTSIALAAGTKGQAAKIISEKIDSFYDENAALRFEIGNRRDNIKTSYNEAYVKFKNGSKIQAVTSNDNSRGIRANILIVDEFRMVNKTVLDKVLKPFLNVVRQPRYLTLPEYKDYPKEENKQIYISSAWWKSHWSWDEFQAYLKKMLKGDKYFVADLPYQLSIHHGLLTKQIVNDERTSDSFDQNGFDMEYEAIFVGENDKAYFKLDKLNKIRTLNKTFIPPTNREYLENKNLSQPKKLSNMPKRRDIDEIRIISLDIALMGGNKNVKNDTSAFTCFRLIRDGDSYRREVVYLESINDSISSQNLAIRLKQLYNDFQADYVVMDANGNGLGVFDACATVLHDQERDEDYPAWASMNDEATNERTKTHGLPIVYTVKASAAFNNEIAQSLNSAIESGKLRLPINHIEKREDLVNSGGFMKKSVEEQQRELYSFNQATALVNELVNLEYEVREGKIRIREVGTTTKDRYSSIAYGNFYANELEKDLRAEEASRNLLDFIFV